MVEPRPTGMRIQRPYKTEEEYIRGDGLTIARMGMILPGAPERPPGIIVRFEIVLADGQPVFRGEGKVVAHRVHSNGRKGLEVKFTKLDSHSKTVVERALELRRTGALSTAPPVPDLTPVPASSQPPPLQAEVEIRKAGETITSSSALPPAVTPSQEAVAQARQEQEPAVPALEVRIEEPQAPVSSPLPQVELRQAQPEVHAAVAPAPEHDDAPTPYAPPVVEPTTPPAAAAHLAPSAPGERADELERLRGRQATVDVPTGRNGLLERLRKRGSGDQGGVGRG